MSQKEIIEYFVMLKTSIEDMVKKSNNPIHADRT